MSARTFILSDESKMLDFGTNFAERCQQFLAKSLENSLTIYLNGELGAGKTTLSRSIVQAFGYNGKVKSPTYTLVEEYSLPPFFIYHFDLYRLADPEELEFMGIRDYFRPQTLCLLEWAEKGKGMIPPADFTIQINYLANTNEGRELILQVHSTNACTILQNFADF